jgi:hypothetical protein
MKNKRIRKSIPILDRLRKYTHIPVTNKGKDDYKQCWIWHGCKNNAGYGLLRVSREIHMATAHRIMYIETYKTVNYGDKVEIQHKCGNKLCVNPKHLQVGDIKTRHELQRKYNAYNDMMKQKEMMWPVCEHCGGTTYLPHFARIHRVCNTNAKYKYMIQSISGKQ